MYITPRIIEVKALENYYIYIKFKTGEEKVYDMSEYIKEIEFYNKLKNREYFENVHPRGCSIEWANGEDIAPENLYYDSMPFEDFKKKIK